VQPLFVVDLFREVFDRGASLCQIAIFLPVDLLVFQRLQERLAGGVVVWIPATAHADLDAVFPEQMGAIPRGVLHAAVGVMRQTGLSLAIYEERL
jgi:hypothetical protein